MPTRFIYSMTVVVNKRCIIGASGNVIHAIQDLIGRILYKEVLFNVNAIEYTFYLTFEALSFHAM